MIRRARGDGREVCIRAVERPSRLEPPEDAEPPLRPRRQPALTVVAHHRVGAHGQGDVEAAANLHSLELGSGDADDLGRLAVQHQRLSDDVRLPAIRTLPEGMTQDRLRRAPVPIVGDRQQASDRGPYPQHLEQAAADPQSGRQAHLPAIRGVEGIAAPGEHSAECFLPMADCFPSRIRDCRMPRLKASSRAVQIDDADLGQRRGVGNRQALSRIALTIWKRDVFAPITSASDTIATAQTPVPGEEAKCVSNVLTRAPATGGPTHRASPPESGRGCRARVAPRRRLVRSRAARDALVARHAEGASRFPRAGRLPGSCFAPLRLVGNPTHGIHQLLPAAPLGKQLPRPAAASR